MSDDLKFTAAEWHRKQAVDLFNFTWTLIDKPNRTPDDDEQMIHAAHASRYHWSVVGTAVNFLRGDWQIARVTRCSTCQRAPNITRSCACGNARRIILAISTWLTLMKPWRAPWLAPGRL